MFVDKKIIHLMQLHLPNVEVYMVFPVSQSFSTFMSNVKFE